MLNIGDVVYIPRIPTVKKDCLSHRVGWSESMEQTLGVTGRIIDIHNDCYAVYFVLPNYGSTFYYPKESLELWVSCFPEKCKLAEERDTPIIARIKKLNHKWATKQIAKGKKGEFYDKMLCV